MTSSQTRDQRSIFRVPVEEKYYFWPGPRYLAGPGRVPKFPFPRQAGAKGPRTPNLGGMRDAQNSSFQPCDGLFLVPVNEFGRQVHREQRRGSKITFYTIVFALLGPEESWGV